MEIEKKELFQQIKLLRQCDKEKGVKIEMLEKTVEDLKLSVEMTDLSMQKNNHDVEKTKKMQDQEMKLIKETVQERLDIQEDRSRRNNIRIGGVPEDENESWETSKRKAKEFFKNTLKIESDIVVQRAHRSLKNSNGKGKGPRVLVMQLLNYEDKEVILSKGNMLKGTPYFISSDYCQNTVSIHKRLWKEIKDLRKEGKRVFLGYRKIEFKGTFGK